MMVQSKAADKKQKSELPSWFGQSQSEENDDGEEPQHTPHPRDNSMFESDRPSGRSESLDRRRTFSGESRPRSAIAIARANKPRIRTTPLKRTASPGSDPSKSSGHLIRMSSKNDSAIVISRSKFHERQEDLDTSMENHSAQSSITNSWAPRAKLYHPAPYVPHRPIENMVISIHKPGSETEIREELGKVGDDNTNSTARSFSAFPGGSFRRNATDLLHGVLEADENDTKNHESSNTCMISLALTEEQKADVEKYVFRGWGSDDDADDQLRPGGNNSNDHEQNLRDIAQNPVVNQQVIPISTPQAIQDAINELQVLTGMQVKCLDDDAVNVCPDAGKEGLLTNLACSQPKIILGESEVEANIDVNPNEKSRDDFKPGWFFGSQALKTDESEIDVQLGQPYALIRNDKDEERFRKHYEEQERKRLEKEMSVEQEKKKKKGSWFFFSNEEESVAIINDESIADALDDLEILAGEVRVSQVKEARLLEKELKERRGNSEAKLGVDKLRASLRSDPLPRSELREEDAPPITSNSFHGVQRPQGHALVSPDVTSNARAIDDYRKKAFLSRFELPLETSNDNDETREWSEGSEIRHLPPAQFGRASVKQMMSKSFPNLARPHACVDGMHTTQRLPGENSVEHSLNEDAEINESSVQHFKASTLKKEALIDDLSKRDTRWQLNKSTVNSTFKQYHADIARIDGLLPSDDEFDILKHVGDLVDVQYRDVRNAMLEDSNLSEREVASFFVGFSLLAVKARSLISQVQALKAVSRTNSDERNTPNPNSETPVIEDLLNRTPRVILVRSLLADLEISAEAKALLRQVEDNERARIALEVELYDLGTPLPEHIPFDEANAAVERLSKRIKELRSQNTDFMSKNEQSEHASLIRRLELSLRKNNLALTMSGAFVSVDEKWEADNATQNFDALRRIRRHMPVNVEFLNEDQLVIETTPNGKLLPRRIARKFKQTAVLQLLRIGPDDLFRIHPSTFENLETNGLTLTERRAIYSHLKDVGMRWREACADPAASRKWLWFRMLKQDFKESLILFDRHCQEYGPPDNHQYATRSNPTSGCPLIGTRCPVKAEKLFDYGVDYGFPDGDVFFEDDGTNERLRLDSMEPPLASENSLLKNASRRSEPIKSHYKGRVLEIALATDSCETMDKIMDRMEYLWETWFEDRLRREKAKFTVMHRRMEIGSYVAAVQELKLSLTPLAVRSGMQLTGNRDSNAARPDYRSPIELGLCEEVWEHSEDFLTGIESRLKELDANDSELKKEIGYLRDLIDELHNRNMSTINELGVRYPEASRKLTKRKEIERRVRDRLSSEDMIHCDTVKNGDCLIGTDLLRSIPNENIESECGFQEKTYGPHAIMEQVEGIENPPELPASVIDQESMIARTVIKEGLRSNPVSPILDQSNNHQDHVELSGVSHGNRHDVVNESRVMFSAPNGDPYEAGFSGDAMNKSCNHEECQDKRINVAILAPTERYSKESAICIDPDPFVSRRTNSRSYSPISAIPSDVVDTNDPRTPQTEAPTTTSQPALQGAQQTPLDRASSEVGSPYEHLHYATTSGCRMSTIAPMGTISNANTNFTAKDADNEPRSIGRKSIDCRRARRSQMRSTSSHFANEIAFDAGEAVAEEVKKPEGTLTSSVKSPLSAKSISKYVQANDASLYTKRRAFSLPSHSQSKPIHRSDELASKEKTTSSEVELSSTAYSDDHDRDGARSFGRAAVERSNEIDAFADLMPVDSPRRKGRQWRERLAHAPGHRNSDDSGHNKDRQVRERKMAPTKKDLGKQSEGVFPEYSKIQRPISLPYRYARRAVGIEQSGKQALECSSSGRRHSIRDKTDPRAKTGEEPTDSGLMISVRGTRGSPRERIAARRREPEAIAGINPGHGGNVRLQSCIETPEASVGISDSACETSVTSLSKEKSDLSEKIDDVEGADKDPISSFHVDYTQRQSRDDGAFGTSDNGNLLVAEASQMESHDTIGSTGRDESTEGISEFRQMKDSPLRNVEFFVKSALPASDDVVPVDLLEGDSRALLEKIAKMKRDVVATDPFVRVSPSERKSELKDIDVQSSQDPIRMKTQSLRELSSAGGSTVDQSIDLMIAPSTRNSTELLRERLATRKSPGRNRVSAGKSPGKERASFGKSPGRDRDNNGAQLCGDSAERLAFLEARRASLQAGIAERRKARSDAEKLCEIKMNTSNS